MSKKEIGRIHCDERDEIFQDFGVLYALIEDLEKLRKEDDVEKLKEKVDELTKHYRENMFDKEDDGD